MVTSEGLVLLGATGSIGTSALDVVTELADRYRVVGLTCDRRWRELAALAVVWRPEAVAITDERAWREAMDAGAFDAGVTCLGGAEALVALAAWPGAAIVLNAVVGAAGLPATLAALEADRRVALANKESLVVGGDLVLAAAGGAGGRLLPVDSEHSALWQLAAGHADDAIRRVVLTASGGPFHGATVERLATVTPEEALSHPTWSMGPKVTIDSATLANKGLEIIEAHHLFGLDYDAIDVVVHRQSIVHGLVELVDGTLLAEMGRPDMRAPIRAALTWPDRVGGGRTHDLTALSGLTFEHPDLASFPALRLAREAGVAGGTAPAVYNAANEVAVEAFLASRMGFLQIPRTIERVLEAHDVVPADSIDALLEADRWARERAVEWTDTEGTPKAIAG